MSIVSPESRHRFVRRLLLLCLVAAIFFAYWKHFGHRMDEIFSRNITDNAKILSKDEKNSLLRAMAAFKQQFGLELKVDIHENKIPAINPSGHAALLSIGVREAEVEIILPLVAQKAINESNLRGIQSSCSTCLKSLPPATCLFNVIQSLADALTP